MYGNQVSSLRKHSLSSGGSPIPALPSKYIYTQGSNRRLPVISVPTERELRMKEFLCY